MVPCLFSSLIFLSNIYSSLGPCQLAWLLALSLCPSLIFGSSNCILTHCFSWLYSESALPDSCSTLTSETWVISLHSTSYFPIVTSLLIPTISCEYTKQHKNQYRNKAHPKKTGQLDLEKHPELLWIRSFLNSLKSGSTNKGVWSSGSSTRSKLVPMCKLRKLDIG